MNPSHFILTQANFFSQTYPFINLWNISWFQWQETIQCSSVLAQCTVHFIKLNFEFKFKRMYSSNIINNVTEKHSMDHKQRRMIINKARVCMSLTTVKVIKINYLLYPHKCYHVRYDFKQLCRKLEMYVFYLSFKLTSKQENYSKIMNLWKNFHFETA